MTRDIRLTAALMAIVFLLAAMPVAIIEAQETVELLVFAVAALTVAATTFLTLLLRRSN